MVPSENPYSSDMRATTSGGGVLPYPDRRMTPYSVSCTFPRFDAASNKTYTVEYKNTFNTSSWSLVQGVPSGAARTVQVTNNAAGATNRFYRVRTP